MSEKNSVRTDRSRYADVNKEPTTTLPPLPAIKKAMPIRSLRDAVNDMRDLITDLDKYVSYSLQQCQHPQEGLTVDQSAALYLYSLQWPEGQNSFYTLFNRALRHEDRLRFIPFQHYYHLFMSALDKLPSVKDRVWRGVNGDISHQYLKGTVHIWWGVSSCTDEVFVTDTFLDKKQPRTLFNIKCSNGKSIKKHSEFPSESETLLAPGTALRVISQSNPAENLHIVQCEQIDQETDEDLARSSAITADATVAIEASTKKSLLYLMWADQKVHKFEANHDMHAKLTKVFQERFLLYETADECERSVRQRSEKDAVILIISGKIGRQLVPQIHHLEQVKTIMVYCRDAKGNKKWSKDYAKVTAVIVRLDELLEKVEEEKSKWKSSQASLEDDPVAWSPVSECDRMLLVSLKDAIKPLRSICPDIGRMVDDCLKNRPKSSADGLTRDESAAILIYTMECEDPMYRHLNSALRSEDQSSIKPYLSYMKLFLTALRKLPSYKGVVYRAVKLDVSSKCSEGDHVTWWTFSSATSKLNVMKSSLQAGCRTLFTIECRNGKCVRNYTAYPEENEVILMAGSQFKVKSISSMDNSFTMIHLKEINPSD